MFVLFSVFSEKESRLMSIQGRSRESAGVALFCFFFSIQCFAQNLIFLPKGSLDVAAGEVIFSEDTVTLAVTTKSQSPASLILRNFPTAEELVLPIPDSTQAWGLDFDGSNLLYIGIRNSEKEAAVLQYDLTKRDFIKFADLPEQSLVSKVLVLGGLVFVGTYPHARVYVFEKDGTLRATVNTGGDIITCFDYIESGYVMVGYGSPAGVAFIEVSSSTHRAVLHPIAGDSYAYSCASANGSAVVGTQPSGRIMTIPISGDASAVLPVNSNGHTVDGLFVDQGRIYFTQRPSGALYFVSIDSGETGSIGKFTSAGQHRYLSGFPDGLVGIDDSGGYYFWSEHSTESGTISAPGAKSYTIHSLHSVENRLIIGENNNIRVYCNDQPDLFADIAVAGEPKAFSHTEDYLYFGLYEGAGLFRISRSQLDCDMSTAIDVTFIAKLDGLNRPVDLVTLQGSKIVLAALPFPGALRASILVFDEESAGFSEVLISNDANVSSMVECGNELFIGTTIWGEGVPKSDRDAGLYKIEFPYGREVKKIETRNIPGIKKIHDMACLDGEVLLLSDNGLFITLAADGSLIRQLRIATNLRHSHSHKKPALHVVDRTVFISTGNRLLRYSRLSNVIEEISSADHAFLSSAGDSIYYQMGGVVVRHED